MADKHASEPHVLDQPWRVWSTVAVLGILLSGILLGVLIIPIVQLVELGDPRRNIPPCAACHRAGAGGPIETPVLAEQRAEYIVQQLRLYASGERHNDVYARMRTVPRTQC